MENEGDQRCAAAQVQKPEATHEEKVNGLSALKGKHIKTH